MFSEKRQLVIEYSIQIERIVSKALSTLLGIDSLESKSFGNTNDALSFKSKLVLLGDIKTIDKSDKIKFEYFASIRNQFAHNIDAVDFTSCFKALVDIENKLRKLYKDKINGTSNMESQREELFNHLHNDIIDISSKLFQAIFDKGLEEGKKDGATIMKEILFETIQEFMLLSANNRQLLTEILETAKDKYAISIEKNK